MKSYYFDSGGKKNEGKKRTGRVLDEFVRDGGLAQSPRVAKKDLCHQKRNPHRGVRQLFAQRDVTRRRGRPGETFYPSHETLRGGRRTGV